MDEMLGIRRRPACAAHGKEIDAVDPLKHPSITDDVAIKRPSGAHPGPSLDFTKKMDASASDSDLAVKRPAAAPASVRKRPAAAMLEAYATEGAAKMPEISKIELTPELKAAICTMFTKENAAARNTWTNFRSQVSHKTKQIAAKHGQGDKAVDIASDAVTYASTIWSVIQP